jgi:proline iminopeptidase
LILVSTEAAGHSHRERRIALFERLGGSEVGTLARRRFLEGKLDQEALEAWVRLAFPVHTRAQRDPQATQRAIRRPEVNYWFARPGGEGFFPLLSRIRCPTLVLGGEEDPMIPIECQEDLVAALPAHLVRFERIPNCGHSVIADAPLRAFAVIRDFIIGY